MGNVYEPYLALTPHLDVFTKRLLDGDSFAEAAYAFAAEVLAPRGSFVAKVFQGGATGTLLAQLKREVARLVIDMLGV